MMLQYKEGYKYQLVADMLIVTPVRGVRVEDPFFSLEPDGLLLVRAGYAWDGASGPTFDTPSSMAPSMVHDVFCQMMQDRRLDWGTWQGEVNRFFRKMCLVAGMDPVRATLWYWAVSLARAGDPEKSSGEPVRVAPLGGMWGRHWLEGGRHVR